MTRCAVPERGAISPAIGLVHVTTVPMTLGFLRGQVTYMAARGFAVAAISSPGEALDAFARTHGVRCYAVAMERRITPVRDLLALLRLWSRLRRIRPQIVHAHTPKGGLLGMLAAWLARVPVRVYHLRGLPLATARGPKRFVLRCSERLACGLAHRVLCVSHSLRAVALQEGVCAAAKLRVLGAGSGNGVDARGWFDPGSADLVGQRALIRERLRIPQDGLVIGFVGRVAREKGVVELMSAWDALAAESPHVYLLLVGPLEPLDPVPPAIEEQIRRGERVCWVGAVVDMPPLYAAMDVLALATYREGFPNVLLEAAAMGLPVVASDVCGCTDAVQDGVTGTLVACRDSAAPACALRSYLESPALRREHGRAGRQRVLREFAPERIWGALAHEYDDLLRARGLRASTGDAQPLATFSRSPRCTQDRLTAGFLKRLIDIAVAAAGLVALAPALLLIAAAVRLTMGAPVLFQQRRPGLGGRPFRLLKFRTMRSAEGPDGQPKPDSERVTPLGCWLRSTSLDELPQLWNVLKGEMSLVGPRPLLMEYLPRYTAEQARRHELRPGITGWAQVNGRNALHWEDKFDYDVWYVDHWSVPLDLKILLRTMRKVVLRQGIASSGDGTVSPFLGSSREGS